MTGEKRTLRMTRTMTETRTTTKRTTTKRTRKVFSNSPAEGELQRGDVIISIGERRGDDLTHKQAKDLIGGGGGQINLVVTRPPAGRHDLTHPKAPTFRTPAPVAPRTNVPKAMPYGGSGGHSAGHKPTKINLSKLGGGGPDFGTDYSHYTPPVQPSSSAHQYRPAAPQQGQMLNKVQESLDNIIYSPSYQQPQYQQQQQQPQYQQQQQQPQYQQPQYQEPPFFSSPGQAPGQAPPFQPNMSLSGVSPHQGGYQPTFEKVDSGQYSEEQEEFVPVWERRKTYQEPKPSGFAPMRSTPIPKVPKPIAHHPDAPSFGIDYTKPQSSASNMSWKPQAAPPPQQQPSQPIQSEPPRYQNEPQVASPWRTSLRSTGVKPWDSDLDYGAQRPTPRSGAFNPLGDSQAFGQFQPVSHDSPATGPSWDGQVEGEDDDDPTAPKYVHLQYNSPMGLYSKANVQETLDGQKKAPQHPQPQMPPQPQQVQIQSQSVPQQHSSKPARQPKEGDRDWNDSAVYRMIHMDHQRRGPAPPQQQQQHQQQQQQQHQHHRVAPPPLSPKPAVSPMYQPSVQFGAPTFEDELGVSDF